MQETGETTRIVSAKDLRERALHEMYSIGARGSESYTERLRGVSSYTAILTIVDAYVLALPNNRIILRRAALMEISAQVAEQLVRIEREHEGSTSLVALRDRVVGIVTVSGYEDVEKHARFFLNVRTYEELRTLVHELCQIMEANSYEQAHARLCEVLVTLDDKLACE
ncbi:MAG TPA: hypothetical protein QF549_00585 [Candidatus Saccharimonadaceae bacterium]|nr:hypothetical protein [Candidatus Saccharimonadaceae bacterium]